MSSSLSIVEFHGNGGKHRCGYCASSSSSCSTGMTAHIMTVADYQDLIDRGWRRSGQYCYKPNNKTTCCPAYTIKCDAVQFKMSKSHKKIIKRMNKFLMDGIIDKLSESGEMQEPSEAGGSSTTAEDEYLKAVPKQLTQIRPIIVKETSVKMDSSQNMGEQPAEDTPSVSQSHSRETPQKKAKLIRLERREAKLKEKGVQSPCVSKSPKSPEKSLEEFLAEAPVVGLHKLEVKLVTDRKGCSDEAYILYKKYQMFVHKDKDSDLTRSRFKRFLCHSSLQIKLVLSSTKEFKQKYGALEFQLFNKYQTTIHKSPESLQGFYQFLVDSPLQAEGQDSQSHQLMGSFHQQYYLDGKLIAVGVIDILPTCVSSVYFFYDPAYNFLSLGTYGSLQELAFVRKLQESMPALSQYYMGFYIHSCPKMRYKAKLTPSYLVCPEAYTWHAITDELLQKLNNSKYSRFNDNLEATDPEAVTRDDMRRIPIYNNGRPIFLEEYLRTNSTSTMFSKTLAYAQLVGRSCASRMLLFIE